MGAKLAVSAGLDGLKDGIQQRLLRVTAQWFVNTQLMATVSVGDIPVSSSLIYLSHSSRLQHV